MRKIPTVFVRDVTDMKRVMNAVTPGCEWVFDDPAAVATRKYDGTCVMLDDDGRWWARREVKPGKPSPAGFVPVETDRVTGKTVGWEPMEQSGFARWHAEAVASMPHAEPGTYELIGPKINGNPEKVDGHALVLHARAQQLEGVPSDFGGLAAWMQSHLGYEGIVWHHPDGRMAKLKARDFPRQTAAESLPLKI